MSSKKLMTEEQFISKFKRMGIQLYNVKETDRELKAFAKIEKVLIALDEKKGSKLNSLKALAKIHSIVIGVWEKDA